MSSNQENDDDSFILILGTSPNGTVKCHGTTVNGDTMQKYQIDDAMRNLPEDASRAFKAQFHLGESPSPASLMVASTLITDDRSTEELQKRFGELLDENVVLKETLKQNNDSMKEQFMLIASCQEDMLKTHKLHREKFDETRELVERLRKENKQLKLDLTKQLECEQTGQALNKETGENKVGPSSTVEFVTSPEDDTIYKLTAQLELVEKQRRQVIVENEKLTWQKESLEHMTDATSRERDDLKEKLKDLELKCLSIDNEHAQEVSKLNFIIDDLQKKIKQNSVVLPKEIQERDRQIQGKMSVLQNDLKKAQMRILDLENDKLEYSQHKSGVSDTVRAYTEQIQELQSRLKSVQTTVVLPKEIQERDRQIQELQGKVSVLQNELQKAQMRILDLENVKLEYSQHKSGVSDTVRVYTEQIQELQSRLKSVQTTVVLPKEIQERDRQIQELQGKVSVLQNELKNAQMRILDLENVKLEYSQHKSGVSDTVRAYTEQIQELRSRLKSVQTTVFQPLQISIASEEGTSDPSYMSNVKLYDRTLKHLSDYLNGLVNGLTDSLVQTLMAISTVQEVKIDPNSVNQVKTSLNDVKSTLEKQHSSTVSFISNIRGTLSIFEGIFKDYNELLKKKVTSTEPKPPSVDQLTSALLARAQEVTLLQAQVAQLTMHKDEAQVLQAQLELYKADFEAERQSREKMASDKDSLETDLRTAQKKIIELTTQLAEAQKEVTSTSTVRKTPVTYYTVPRPTGTVPRPTGTVPRPTGTVPRPTGIVDRPAGAVTRPVGTAGAAARPADNSSDVAFTCPKCFVFRSNDYAKMEEHFGYCLDDF